MMGAEDKARRAEAKGRFVDKFLPAALQVEAMYGVHPVACLAQCAVESGWGASSLAACHHNYFGIIGYGARNSYWTGRKSPAGRSGLVFRSYDTPVHSFLDFGRLIATAYKAAAAVSHLPEAYAHEIAYSPYLSEQNGDNREAYKKMIAQIGRSLEKIVEQKTKEHEEREKKESPPDTGADSGGAVLPVGKAP